MKIDKKIGLVLSGGGGRGAYEIGALRYLYEMGVYPGVVAGTSVGSINGAAMASGMSLEEIENLWLNIRAKNIFKYSLWKSIKGIFQPYMSPFFDTAPLRKLLQKHLDFDKVKKSEIKLFVSAVDIGRGEVKVFTNDEIGIDHIVASASIPVIFPWTQIQGRTYWDGGIVANTPIVPVLEAGARDIYAILLSPYKEDNVSELPKNKLQAIARLLDFTLMGSFEMVFNSLSPTKVTDSHYRIKKRGFGTSNLFIVEPKASLGLYSILNFSKKQAAELLGRGYEDAKNDLDPILKKKK